MFSRHVSDVGADAVVMEETQLISTRGWLAFPAAVATCVAASIVLWALRCLRGYRMLSEVPGPPARHFVLGHAGVLASERAKEAIVAWAAMYGRIYKLRVLLHQPVVVVSDPIEAKALLSRGPRCDSVACRVAYWACATCTVLFAADRSTVPSLMETAISAIVPPHMHATGRPHQIPPEGPHGV
jgi:hypothetical protein